MGREAKACYVLIFFLYFLSALLFGLSFHPTIRSTGSQGPCWALSAALFVVSSVVGLIVCCLSDGCSSCCCRESRKSSSKGRRKVTAKRASLEKEFDAEKGELAESTMRKLYPKYPYPRPPPLSVPGSPMIRIPSRVHTASSTDDGFEFKNPRMSGIFGRDEADTPDDAKIQIPKRQSNGNSSGGFGRRIRLPTSSNRRNISSNLEPISEVSLESGRLSRVSTRHSAVGSFCGFRASTERVMMVESDEGGVSVVERMYEEDPESESELDAVELSEDGLKETVKEVV